MDHVGPFTFNAIRSIIGGIVLIPCIFFLDHRKSDQKEELPSPQQQAEQTGTLILGGVCCGILLALASSFQQMGIQYGITDRMGNVLQDVTIPAYPEVETIKERMKAWGAVNAMMSGSGPTVFGVFDNEEKAQEACQKLRESGLCQQVFLTVPFNNYGGRTADDK